MSKCLEKNELRAQIKRANKTNKEVAAHLGINEATLYRKIKANGNFTREEINKLVEFLGIDDPKDIFAEELA